MHFNIKIEMLEVCFQHTPTFIIEPNFIMRIFLKGQAMEQILRVKYLSSDKLKPVNQMGIFIVTTK